MYNDLVNDCSSWGTAGKNVLMTLAGTHEEQKDDGQASGLKPTLPMFGVSHFLLHYFPDILPLKRVDGEVVFDMTTSIGRKQFTQDGAVKKECSVRGRLRNLQKTQINQPIPADLSKLPKIVKRVLENKKKKDQG